MPMTGAAVVGSRAQQVKVQCLPKRARARHCMSATFSVRPKAGCACRLARTLQDASIATPESSLSLGKMLMGTGRGKISSIKCVTVQYPSSMLSIPDVLAFLSLTTALLMGARAADSLCVHNILKSDDGKELLAPMRDGWYVDADGTRVPQPMHFPTGKRKGLVTILTERALFDPKLKLNAVCGLCSTIPGLMREHQDGSSPCCLRSLLWQQLDFQEAWRRSELAELITSLGHICIFLPKFHPELNFIEMYWGAVKRRTRNICDYSFPALQKNVPEQLDLVGNDLVFLRKLACKSWRYMDAYRKGLSGKPAEHAVKKYHSHRRVPQAAMQAFAV